MPNFVCVCVFTIIKCNLHCFSHSILSIFDIGDYFVHSVRKRGERSIFWYIGVRIHSKYVGNYFPLLVRKKERSVIEPSPTLSRTDHRLSSVPTNYCPNCICQFKRLINFNIICNSSVLQLTTVFSSLNLHMSSVTL